MSDFFDTKEWKLTINLLSLVPYVARGIPEAVALYEKTMQALKSGVTEDEMKAALDERDALIDKILASG